MHNTAISWPNPGMLLLFCGMAVILSLEPLFAADLTAVTPDGRKVILHSNGTWNYWDSTKVAKKQPETTVATQNREKKIGQSTTPTESEAASSSYTDFLDAGDRTLDFRNASWMMSKNQVKASESLTLLQENADTLKYRNTLNEMQCVTAYIFKNDKLVAAHYSIEQKHINPALFNNDYQSLKKYLSNQYGTAVSEQDVWKNDIYRDDKSQWGFAVSIGFLTRFVSWKGPTSKIILQMNGENHKIYLMIKYQAVNS